MIYSAITVSVDCVYKQETDLEVHIRSMVSKWMDVTWSFRAKGHSKVYVLCTVEFVSSSVTKLLK